MVPTKKSKKPRKRSIEKINDYFWKNRRKIKNKSKHTRTETYLGRRHDVYLIQSGVNPNDLWWYKYNFYYLKKNVWLKQTNKQE